MTIDPHIQRAAIVALREVRQGDRIMPPEQLGRALDIAQHAADASGRSIEEILTVYDPDPRIYREPGATFEHTIIDLDEEERYAACQIRHAMMIRWAALIKANPEIEPSLWSIAHDRAIVHVATARAIRKTNGNG